jgi:hypothetical protein
MDNVSFIKSISPVTGEEFEYAFINHGNEEYTSMLKSTYDKMIAAQSTPIDTEDE